MPSFSAFARGPNLVGAASTAKSQVLDAQKVAINASLQRQQLAQQAQQAFLKHQVDLMQLDASRKAVESQAQVAKQNVELKKAYDSQRLALMDRQLAMEEQSAASTMERALTKEKLEREYGDLVKTKMSAGMDVNSAAREAGMQTGWRGWQGLPAAAIPVDPKAVKPQEEPFWKKFVNPDGSPEIPEIPVPGYGRAFPTSKGSVRLVPDAKVPMRTGGPDVAPVFKEVPLDQVEIWFKSLPKDMQNHPMNQAALAEARKKLQGGKPQSQPPKRDMEPTPSGKRYKVIEK
jgi:hypothetical protein